MFEDLIKTLEGLNGRSVSVRIDADEKGYIDKQCPAEQCEFLFKVNKEDWSNIFKDETVWCPMCRHEAPADQWFTVEHFVEHQIGCDETSREYHHAHQGFEREVESKMLELWSVVRPAAPY